MRRRPTAWLRLALASIAAFLFLADSPAGATIHYRVSLAGVDTHRFQVAMTIPGPVPLGMTVAMPAWNALYEVRDFAYRVRDVKAMATKDNGSPPVPVAMLLLDKQTWRLGEPNDHSAERKPDAYRVTYSVEWNEPGPFSSQLNEHHAFLNLAEALMYAPGRRTEAVEVNFDDIPAGWKVIEELPAGPERNSFSAPSYDALVDAPVEAGTFGEFEFDSAGAHFRVVVDAKSFNQAQLEQYLERITAYQIKLMGGPPFKEYAFVFHFGPRPQAGGGGMEHANSSAMSAPSIDAPDLFAHEFFHAWNVKRIRPSSLEPVDYTKEQYTRALWFAEGVTSTYASYTLVRSGLWSKDDFYDDLATQINELESRPARKWQSVEQSSMDTWLDKYDEYNLPDRSISYYNKGQILGVLLDLAIRDETDNRRSLDDVMRRMNDQYAKQGKFYDDSEGIRAAVEEVAGTSFQEFFHRYVAGLDEIPFDNFLKAAGLRLGVDKVQAVDLGFTPGRAGGQVVVSEVESGSAAEAAGLRPGDIIARRNGQDVPRNRRGWIRDARPGDSVTVQILREGQPLTISYVFAASEEARYSIIEIPSPTDKQQRIREGLLRGITTSDSDVEKNR